jgi:hypothetical protein
LQTVADGSRANGGGFTAAHYMNGVLLALHSKKEKMDSLSNK